jgi:hypothetical protein
LYAAALIGNPNSKNADINPSSTTNFGTKNGILPVFSKKKSKVPGAKTVAEARKALVIAV